MASPPASPTFIYACPLDAWLAMATEGLCAPAKERIEAEIRSHYAEAVGATMAEGHTEEQAHRAAMLALGSATKARRGFRKAYLTEREAKQFVRGGKVSWWAMALNGLLFLFASYFLFLSSKYSPFALWLMRDLPFEAYMASMFVYSLISNWLCPILVQQRRWRRVLAWQIIGFAIMYAGCVDMLIQPHIPEESSNLNTFGIAFAFAIGPVWFVSLLLAIRTMRKLGKHADLCDSFPADEGDFEPSYRRSLFPFLCERMAPWELDECVGHESEGENDDERGGHYA